MWSRRQSPARRPRVFLIYFFHDQRYPLHSSASNQTSPSSLTLPKGSGPGRMVSRGRKVERGSRVVFIPPRPCTLSPPSCPSTLWWHVTVIHAPLLVFRQVGWGWGQHSLPKRPPLRKTTPILFSRTKHPDFVRPFSFKHLKYTRDDYHFTAWEAYIFTLFFCLFLLFLLHSLDPQGLGV